MTTLPDKPGLHYGWVIVTMGLLIVFVALGLARFSYAVFIPGMHKGVGLSYQQLGFIGTCNFAGYLFAVIFTPFLIRRFLHRATITLGLFLIGFGMLGISLSDSFLAIASLYVLVGIGSGFANVSTMVLLPHWFRSRHRGKAAGIAMGGNGLAIVFAGMLIPFLNRSIGLDGWRRGWLIFSLIAVCVAVATLLLVRNTPEEMGLEPVGTAVPLTPEQLVAQEEKGRGERLLFRLGIIYGLFGITFMVYGTFIVATLVKEFGFSEAKAGLYWSWVGIFSLFSGVGFGALSDRIGRNWGLAVVFLVQSGAYLLAGCRLGGAALVLSVLLYGSAFFSIPAIMAAAVGDYLGVARAANAFVLVTIFFAVGQTIGPGGAGVMAGFTGSFTSTFLVSALLTIGAALLSAALPKPRHG